MSWIVFHDGGALICARPLNKTELKSAMRFVPLKVNPHEVVVRISRWELQQFLRNEIGVSVAVPNNDLPPKEVMVHLLNDLNTPGAIAAMHKLHKQGRGRELFAAMNFLGLIKAFPTYEAVNRLPDPDATIPDFGTGESIQRDWFPPKMDVNNGSDH